MLPWHQLGDWLGNFWVHYYNACVSDVQCWCHLHFFMCSVFIVATFFFRVFNLLSPKWGPRVIQHQSHQTKFYRSLLCYSPPHNLYKYWRSWRALPETALTCCGSWPDVHRNQPWHTVPHAWQGLIGWAAALDRNIRNLQGRLRMIKFARWNVVKRLFSLQTSLGL